MTDNQVLDRIGEEIAADDVVLFMKGTPQVPQCGFSAAKIDEIAAGMSAGE